jgi:tight adherence protein B
VAVNRRLLTSLALGLLLVGGSAIPSAAAQAIHIREVDTSGFPSVGVTFALEEPSRLGSGEVQISENGTPVQEALTVEPLRETGLAVDVVLVVDTSGSMEGQPLASAVDAASRFVEGLPDEVRIAALAFDDQPRVLQPLTDDRDAVLQALSSLQANGETALYDAVVDAAGLFEGESQRNIVLLSDGGDTESAENLDAAVAAAQGAGASIFAVGLRTSETDFQALQTLADSTEGRYAPAGAADLTSIYEGLATELSNQYLVTYRSPSSSGDEVSIGVSALGATDTVLVLTPDNPPPAATAPPEPAPVEQPQPLLTGTVGLAVTLGLIFLAIFTLVVMLLGAGARQRREQDLARRLAAAPAARAKQKLARADAPDQGARVWLPQGLVATAQRAAEASGLAKGLDAKLERAGLPIRQGEFILAMIVTGLAGALVAGAVFQRLLLALIFLGFGAAAPLIFVSMKVDRRRRAFDAQLADILMLLASTLRAGHSFLQALGMVAKEVAEPGRQEFARAVAEIRLGRPVDEALLALADRIASDDLKWAIMAVNVQREVGGNLAEVLDTVATTVRDRETVRRQVQVLSVEGRLSAWILGSLPFLFALYLLLVNPGYLSLLFTDPLGTYLVGIGLVMLTAGILWMRKTVRIDV